MVINHEVLQGLYKPPPKKNCSRPHLQERTATLAE